MSSDPSHRTNVAQNESKPRVLVISQVYVPDPASVGQHVADVAEALAARGYAVRVLTSARGYEDPQIRYPRREQRGGVDVRRLALSSFGKKSLAHRIVAQALFLVQVIVHGVFARRLAGIVVSTSPPMASFAAIILGAVRRAPITYWLMDLNPDQAIELGRVRDGSLAVRALRWLNGRIFARAATVIVLDRFMAERAGRQYRVGGRLVVLPPWPHVEAGGGGERRATSGDLSSAGADAGPAVNSFVAEHNLAGRFVVMYSGNHSLASPVTTLVEAALALRDDPRFVFVFIGGGLGKRVVDDAIAAHRPANIVSLPYQPLARIKYSLSAADVHAVTLGNAMVGIIHPCKIYGAMAVGRPVLYIGPRPSHAADLIDEHEIGWHVAHGDVAAAVAALQEAAALAPETRAAMGERARASIAKHYSKQLLCDAFCNEVERSVPVDETVGRTASAAVAAAPPDANGSRERVKVSSQTETVVTVGELEAEPAATYD